MNDQIKEIKSKLDIIEVARGYLPSLKKGGKNYFALCPFHNEDTPSFSLNQDLQLYKCFGCGESGDVLNLIQKIENVDFATALEIAAKRAGIELKKNYDPQTSAVIKERKRLIELNTLVAEYYNYILTKHSNGEKGRIYAKKRGLDSKSINEFKIGYAPESYENLKNFLVTKKFSIQESLKGGVLVEKNGRTYDKFRNRLIFPIFDHRGDCVGFSGRAIGDKEMPKYLNSPETEVFQKSKILYGLYHNRNSIRQKDNAIIVEGQLDVISSWQAGVGNLVAPQGTALTDDQLQLLGRYTANITFCTDNDNAGDKVLIKRATMSHTHKLSVKAITVPQGKDVDELIKIDPKLWIAAVEKQENIIDHLMKRLEKRFDIQDSKAKIQILEILIPILLTLDSKVERQDYIGRIAAWLNVDAAILIESVQYAEQANKNSNYINKIITQANQSPTRSKEQYLLALLVQHKDYATQLVSFIRPTFFSTAAYSRLFDKISNYILENKSFDPEAFLKSLDESNKKIFTDLMLYKLNEVHDIDKMMNEIEKLGTLLETYYYKNQIHLNASKITEGHDDAIINLAEISKKLKPRDNK